MKIWVKRAKNKGKDKAKDIRILVVILVVLFLLNGCQMEEKDASVIIRMILF